MNCSRIREKLPGYLDGALPVDDHGPIRKHLEDCSGCRGELEQYRQLQRMMSHAVRPEPPADLAMRIRVAVSQARASRGWAAHMHRLAIRTQLVLENILEPLAVPATGGVLAALLVFASVMQVFAGGVPFGGIANDLPTNLLQPARLEQLAAFPVPDEGGLLVEATVNAEGQLVNYTILSGLDNAEIRRQLDQVLMFSRFRPQLSFGRPTSGGRVLLSFSGVRVRG
jgi:hypothetical protein